MYTRHIMKIQVTQYHIVRLILYARMHGRQTESAKSLLNLLDILTVDNIYRLEVLKLSHSWHGFLPEVSDGIFQYARNIHRSTTRDIQAWFSKESFLSVEVSLPRQSTLHSKYLSLTSLSRHCPYSFDCMIVYHNYLLFFH